MGLGVRVREVGEHLAPLVVTGEDGGSQQVRVGEEDMAPGRG